LYRALRKARIRLEQFEFVAQAAERVGRDLFAAQQPLLDTGPVDLSLVEMLAAEQREDLLNGLQKLLGMHLAGLALIGTRFGMHGGDAVFLVARIPGLDRAPGEAALIPVFILEAHPADLLDPRLDRGPRSQVNRTQHTHFQIWGGPFHRSNLPG